MAKKKTKKKATKKKVKKKTEPLLYKYRSLNALHFLIDIIKNKELYAAPFTELNDPMEGFYNTSERLSDTIRDRIYYSKMSYRICALSKKNNSTLMWSHYADSHRGVVLGVKLDLRNGGEKTDVVYETSLQTWTKKRNARDFAKEVLMKKLVHWKYEEEVRVLTRRKFVPIEIEEVLIGCKAEKNDVDRIKFLFDGTIDSNKIRILERDELELDS